MEIGKLTKAAKILVKSSVKSVKSMKFRILGDSAKGPQVLLGLE